MSSTGVTEAFIGYYYNVDPYNRLKWMWGYKSSAYPLATSIDGLAVNRNTRKFAAVLYISSQSRLLFAFISVIDGSVSSSG